MFSVMAKRVLRAPLSYFETTPLGRILNRFTYDVEVLDVELSISMTGLVVSGSWLVSAVVAMVVVLPWILLGIVPVTVLYIFIQYYYRMSGPDLQRIDAVSRSPLQASLAEGTLLRRMHLIRQLPPANSQHLSRHTLQALKGRLQSVRTTRSEPLLRNFVVTWITTHPR